MTNRDAGRATALVIGAATLLSAAAPTLARSSPTALSNAMPFDLALHHDALDEALKLAVSADGKSIAYEVSGSDAHSESAARWVTVTDVVTRRHSRLAPQESNCSRPAFSPDGARLAFLCERDEVVHLWLHERAAGTTRRLSDAAIDPGLSEAMPDWSAEGIGAPTWSPDGRSIYFPLRHDASPSAAGAPVPSHAAADPLVQVYRSGRELAKSSDGEAALTPPASDVSLAAIDVSSGAVRVITRDQACAPSGPRVSPSGKWLAYASCVRRSTAADDFPVRFASDLRVVPAAGGAPTSIASAVAASAYSDLRGPHFRDGYLWHPDRDQLFWSENGRIWTLDFARGATQPQALASGLNDIEAPLAVTRDGGTLLVARATDDSASTAGGSLIAVPLDGGEPTVLALQPTQQFLQVLTQRKGVLWQPRGGLVTVLTRELASGDTLVNQFDLRSGQGKIVRREKALIVLAAGSAAHDALFGLYESVGAPGNIYRFDAALSSSSRISEVEPRFSGLRLARAETFRVSVPQFDGSRAEVTCGILLPPGARPGDRLPTVAVLYPRATYLERTLRFGGGQFAGFPSSLLTTRGYAVLLMAAPISPRRTSGHLSNDLIDVLMPQVHGAAAIGYTDIERVGIVGLSFGGYGTALVVSSTNAFRAAVAIAGVYDLTYTATAVQPDGTTRGVSVSQLETNYGVRGSPWEDSNRYLDSSPFFRADRIHTPLLILHTEGDRTPVEDARKLFDALRLLGRTAQYAEYAGAGHGLDGWSPRASVDAGARIVAFFDEYLKPARRGAARQVPLFRAP